MEVKSARVPLIAGPECLERDGAALSVDCLNWPDEYPYAPKCEVLIARTADALVLQFGVEGMDLRATAMQDNGRSWEDSCCEFFISPDGKEYYNMEMTCIGSILLAKGAGREGRIRESLETVAQISRWSSLEKKAYDEEGGCFRWTVRAMIPFGIIGLDAACLPPSVRANFYKCGDLTAHPHFVTWNPVNTPAPDFHRPEFFGTLLFSF